MFRQRITTHLSVLMQYSFEKFKLEWKALTSNHLVLEISENLNIDDVIISLLLIIAEDLNQKGMSFVMIKPSVNIDDFQKTSTSYPHYKKQRI